jgi:NitT/TauT family transport system permease protein
MTTSVPEAVAPPGTRRLRPSETLDPGSMSNRRRIGLFVGFAALVLFVWEAVKWFGGVPWRYENVLGLGVDLFHDPPFRWAFATDLNLPHWWDIGAALAAPVQRNQDDSLLQFLLGASFYTWREAALGFIVGTLLGLLLATLFVHFGLLERALVPYVVASQTIPIVALAPMIVFFVGHNISAVVIIATYLSFFPVTIAMLRGLRSPDPRALELMRSYAATRRAILFKVRFPASVPYLFTAMKITATASVVGAIVGEGPGGIQAGLGRAILFFSQSYSIAPEKLWAAILFTAVLGIAFYGIIRAFEVRVLRGRPEVAGI